MKLIFLLASILLPWISCTDYLGYFPEMEITKSYTSEIVRRDEQFNVKVDRSMANDQMLPYRYLRTKIFFQREFDQASFELRNIIKVAIEKITKNIQPKINTKRGIIYVSPCKDNKWKYGRYHGHEVKICDKGCIKNEHLHPQILQRCFVNHDGKFEIVDTHNTLYINLDLMITVNLVNDCPNNGHMAYGGPAQLAKDDNRPDLGIIWICNNTILTNPKNIMFINEAIQESLIHILGFTPALFSYYRNEKGVPMTKMDEHDEPAEGYMNYLGKARLYKPSEDVLKFSERLEKQLNGSEVNVQRAILTTKYLSYQSEIYFDCDKVKGVYLEQQPEAGIYLSHFEKRIFNGELMTAGLKVKSSLSRFTVALLMDMGFYHIPNPSTIENPFNFGKNAGCDFLEMSCMEYINNKVSKHQSTAPFCFECNARNDTTSLVNDLRPDSCMLFKMKDKTHWADKNKKAGYPDKYAEYCPINYSNYRSYHPYLRLKDFCFKKLIRTPQSTTNKTPETSTTENPIKDTIRPPNEGNRTTNSTNEESTTNLYQEVTQGSSNNGKTTTTNSVGNMPGESTSTEESKPKMTGPTGGLPTTTKASITNKQLMIIKKCVENMVKRKEFMLNASSAVPVKVDCNNDYRMLLEIAGKTFQCTKDDQKVLFQTIHENELYNLYQPCPRCSDFCHKTCPTKYRKWETEASKSFKEWKITEPISMTCIKGKPVFTQTMIYKGV